ncbi:MAG: hypothetical protein ACREFI_10715 [Stellaceae bacterium]
MEQRDAGGAVEIPASQPDGKVQGRERRHQDKARAKKHGGNRSEYASVPVPARRCALPGNR